jgi:hypothetical protein
VTSELGNLQEQVAGTAYNRSVHDAHYYGSQYRVARRCEALPLAYRPIFVSNEKEREGDASFVLLKTYL